MEDKQLQTISTVTEDPIVPNLIPESFIADQSWPSQLQEGIQNLWNNHKLCDASILGSDGKVLKVHKAILCAVSPILQNMFESSDEISLPGMPSVLWTHVVSFIYTGKVSLVIPTKAALKQLSEVSSYLALTRLGMLLEMIDMKEDKGSTVISVKTAKPIENSIVQEEVEEQHQQPQQQHPKQPRQKKQQLIKINKQKRCNKRIGQQQWTKNCLSKNVANNRSVEKTESNVKITDVVGMMHSYGKECEQEQGSDGKECEKEQGSYGKECEQEQGSDRKECEKEQDNYGKECEEEQGSDGKECEEEEDSDEDFDPFAEEIVIKQEKMEDVDESGGRPKRRKTKSRKYQQDYVSDADGVQELTQAKKRAPRKINTSRRLKKKFRKDKEFMEKLATDGTLTDVDNEQGENRLSQAVTVPCPLCDDFTFEIHSYYMPDLFGFQQHLEERHMDEESRIKDQELQIFEKEQLWACKTNYRMAAGEKADELMGRVFVCPFCHRLFAKYQAYRNHLTSSHTEYGNVCYLCKQAFPNMKPMKKHYSEVHGVHDNEYLRREVKMCPTCGKTFRLAVSLQEHEAIHVGVRQIKCRHCPMMFLTTHRRNQHEAKHDPARHHVCSFCGFSTPRKYRLVQHERQHTGEAPLKCAHCRALFVNIRNMEEHICKKMPMPGLPNTGKLNGKQILKKELETEQAADNLMITESVNETNLQNVVSRLLHEGKDVNISEVSMNTENGGSFVEDGQILDSSQNIQQITVWRIENEVTNEEFEVSSQGDIMTESDSIQQTEDVVDETVYELVTHEEAERYENTS